MNASLYSVDSVETQMKGNNNTGKELLVDPCVKILPGRKTST